jgi:hypothetical protein
MRIRYRKNLGDVVDYVELRPPHLSSAACPLSFALAVFSTWFLDIKTNLVFFLPQTHTDVHRFRLNKCYISRDRLGRTKKAIPL